MEKVENIIKELKRAKSSGVILEEQRLMDVIDQIVESIIEDLSHNISLKLWKKHYNEYISMDNNMDLKAELKESLIKANVFCKSIEEEEELNTLKNIMKNEKTLSKVVK